MDRIKDIVGQVIEKIAEKKAAGHKRIDQVWQNILEKKDLQHTCLVGIKEGKLLVAVDSPAWLFQMNIKKQRILERLKEEMPEIQRIHFKIGKVK